MYPSRFFETSRFHCRTKKPPGANLHLSAYSIRAGPSTSSLPLFLSSFPHPSSLARAKSSSSSISLSLSLSLSFSLSRILLEIAARVLGTESEGKGYLGHVGERGNSFNRLIILFKPVAPLARSTPDPLHPCPYVPDPAACWLTLFARIMNSLEEGGEASARNERPGGRGEKAFCLSISFLRGIIQRFQLLQN